MQRRRLALFLILGVMLGLLVSACGVAIGQTQLAPGGPAIANPLANGFSLAALLGDTARTAPSLNSMALTNPLQAASQAQSALTSPGHHGACNGDGGYYGSYSASDD